MEKRNCAYCDTPLVKKNYMWGKFCSIQCHADLKKKTWLEENEEKFQNGTLPSRAAIKKYVKIRDGETCAICDAPAEHNGKPLTLILDHIDGDASNNEPQNFRLVCPNCDSQLPTYKGANRGNGRATKGMSWYSSL